METFNLTRVICELSEAWNDESSAIETLKAVVKAIVGLKQGLWPCGGLDNPPCSRKLQGPVQAARTELTPPLDTQIGLSYDP